MTDRDAMLLELAADVARLVDGWRHVEHVDHDDGDRRIHRHVHPGLLEQLKDAAAGARNGEEGSRQILESRPPVVEEPFELLLAAQACAAYLVSVVLHGSLRESTVDNLRAVVGLAGAAEEDALLRCWVDVASLRDRAEVALGWRPRAFRPRVRCPECNALATIVIKVEGGQLTDARCSSCRTSWPREHWGLLAGSV